MRSFASKPLALLASSVMTTSCRSLTEIVYDPDSEVRAAALDALGSIGGQAAIRVLRQVEQDDEFEEEVT